MTGSEEEIASSLLVEHTWRSRRRLTEHGACHCLLQMYSRLDVTGVIEPALFFMVRSIDINSFFDYSGLIMLHRIRFLTT